MSDQPNIPGGYILLSRKLIESEIWDKPPLYIKVWIYLLSKAQHKPYKKMQRGQVFTSIPEIIEACSWKVGYRKEKPTKDQIFQVIDWLRKAHETSDESNTKATMITTTKATHGLLVTIDNYCFYQNPKNYESNGGSSGENSMRATREQRQPDNTNKNEKNDKELKPSRRKRVYDKESIHYQLAERLYQKILENNPDHKKPDLQKWSDDVRLMMERDNRTKEQVKYLIDWTQQDSFWSTNILSPAKLRKQYDQLVIRVKNEKQGSPREKRKSSKSDVLDELMNKYEKEDEPDDGKRSGEVIPFNQRTLRQVRG